MRFQVAASNFEREVRRARDRYKKDIRRAAQIATDRASKHAQNHLRVQMRNVGLGRLGMAVGQTSALKKRQHDRIYGVIYAKGRTNDDNRAAGAIEAYSRGATIRARNVSWLAYQTNAIPRRVGRFRMTPARYRSGGWESRLGKLEFRPISKSMALLVAKRVTVHPRTGRARPAGPGKTRTRIPQAEIVVFVLIRVTRRAKRFDEKQIVAQHARTVPRFMEDAMKEMQGRGGG